MALAAALRGAAEQHANSSLERWRVRQLMKVHNGLVWVLNGERVARDLGTPDAHFRHAIPLIARALSPLDRLRRHSSRVDAALAKLGNASFRARVQQGLAGREPDFTHA